MTANTSNPATWATKAAIAELRNRYAVATDMAGQGDDGKAKALAIYRQIFTPDASIGADGIEAVTGPEAWADICYGALSKYVATQHLIGTQLVTIESLPDAAGNGGIAHMSSYLQAWHAWEDKVFTFFGTYEDTVVSERGLGWRISKMHLHRTSGDYRELVTAPPA